MDENNLNNLLVNMLWYELSKLNTPLTLEAYFQ